MNREEKRRITVEMGNLVAEKARSNFFLERLDEGIAVNELGKMIIERLEEGLKEEKGKVSGYCKTLDEWVEMKHLSDEEGRNLRNERRDLKTENMALNRQEVIEKRRNNELEHFLAEMIDERDSLQNVINRVENTMEDLSVAVSLPMKGKGTGRNIQDVKGFVKTIQDILWAAKQ